MKTAMLLAPWLATYTYACPHLIVPTAVAGVNVRPAVKAIRTPSSAPATIAPRVQRPPPPEPKRADFLMFKDDAWRSASALTPETADAEISDARLLSTRTANGDREWTVEAPITFKYSVRETPDVLDLSNDALVFGHLGDAASLARAKSRPLKRVVVVDDTVHSLYGDRIEAYFAHHNVTTKMLVLPTTEENKNIDMVLEIAEAIHTLGIDRRLDPVIAIGGGVCMDIVGFAASIYRRRTPYVRVPTTLMGYVDASVGAKSGVNFHTEADGWRKNKLGAYLPPVLTLLDRSFLGTLDQRQLSNGAAEIAKMALVKDPVLFDDLCSHGSALIAHKFQDLPQSAGGGAVPSRVLDASIHTMLEELAPNLFEDSLHRLVDFGHVFSMELEMAVLHSEKLFHGEAVAIDMAFSCVLAYVRGHLDEATLNECLDMLTNLGLPTYHEKLDAPMLNQALYERVKFSQGQKIPLPVAPGVSRIFNDVTSEQVLEALDEWAARCAAK